MIPPQGIPSIAAGRGRCRPALARATTTTVAKIDIASRAFGVDADDLKRMMESPDGGAISREVPDARALATALRTDLVDGIAGGDLEERRKVFGSNRVAPRAPVAFLDLVWEALQDFTLLVLIASGLLSLSLEAGLAGGGGGGNWIEGAAILASVCVVVAVTAVTNYQKESKFRELNALKDDVKVRTIREGVEQEVSSFDLVVGDLVIVEAGDILEADGVLFQGDEIKVDESHLTGESDDVVKTPEELCLMYSGSKVMQGYGQMLVVAVGPNSQQGLISTLVSGTGVQERSPEDSLRDTTVLTQKLERLAKQIGNFGVLAAGVTLIALVSHFSWDTFVVNAEPWDWEFLETYLHYLTTSITILVVAVPEGLPLAVTLALAFSVQRMMADNNLVRHLDACETMACATTVCSDKTGTLTLNDMRVVRLWAGGRLYRVSASQHGSDLASSSGHGAMDIDHVGGHVSGLLPPLSTMLTESIAINSTACMEVDGETGEVELLGNRTECGLLKFLGEDLRADYKGVRESKRVLRTWPFSSDRKRMATLVADDNGTGVGIYHVKGAAEIVLELCTRQICEDGSRTELTEESKLSMLPAFGNSGLRLLCLAFKEVPLESEGATAGGSLPGDCQASDQLDRDLVLLGIVGLQDPVRPEVPRAIEQCQRAGVAVKMLTGDNAATASAIAQECGILPQLEPTASSSGDFRVASDGTEEASSRAAGALEGWMPSWNGSKGPLVLEGPQFRTQVLREDGTLNQEAFDELWPKFRVMARCSPLDKYTIIQGVHASRLKKGREIVAMTGDGTNDAPALRIADVGFAMASGTPIAREASDILLLDDSFTSIVSALKWGRNVYASVSKFLQFQLTVNVVAVLTACAGALWLKESPLSAVQMLWVNLIMDSLASLSLATEAPKDDVLDSVPYDPLASLVTPTVLRNIVGQSAYQLLVMYILVFHGSAIFQVDQAHEFTIVFNAFVFMQLFNQVNSRKIHDEGNVLEGLLGNKLFCGILGLEAAAQVLIVQLGGAAFQTTPLTLTEWEVCVGLGALSLPVREVLRRIRPFEKLKEVVD
ncbi:unnamed protein product [Ostreobium quekettii]|uniref:P-type Ca(2+) transporter n=1 Tax=Ostreobium quekettii TaxID=121088 RepID=A0A8S1IYZ5_9CHLO|nr:unnamed protein product [Ostreobium quekettii]|eukprot:evm.model.scf_397.4 EVM.evm.TU.scf_397.4   scf_397:32158-42979(+)